MVGDTAKLQQWPRTSLTWVSTDKKLNNIFVQSQNVKPVNNGLKYADKIAYPDLQLNCIQKTKGNQFVVETTITCGNVDVTVVLTPVFSSKTRKSPPFLTLLKELTYIFSKSRSFKFPSSSNAVFTTICMNYNKEMHDSEAHIDDTMKIPPTLSTEEIPRQTYLRPSME